MESNKKLRVGIIGLGEHMIRAHVVYLLQDSRVAITHFYDPQPKDLVTIFGNHHHPQPVADVNDIYVNPEIDAVFIGSLDQQHMEQLLNCLKNGKHVFCEKPVGITPEEISQLTTAFEAYGNDLVISSCHPRRFDPPITWLKKQLDNSTWVEQHLGVINHFSFDFWYHEVTDNWKKDQSLLLDHFGHEIDLMRFLFDSHHIDEVTARLIHDSYDAYQVTGNVRSISFAFTGNRKDTESVYNESLRIDGTKGSLVINLNTGNLFFANTGSSLTVPKIDYEYRFTQVTNDFITAVVDKVPPYLSLKDIFINNAVGVAVAKTGSYPVITTK